MKDFLNSPWINRILLLVVAYFAEETMRENRELRIEVQSNIQKITTDIEVMKKEIQLLTDYKIDPKK